MSPSFWTHFCVKKDGGSFCFEVEWTQFCCISLGYYDLWYACDLTSMPMTCGFDLEIFFVCSHKIEPPPLNMKLFKMAVKAAQALWILPMLVYDASATLIDYRLRNEYHIAVHRITQCFIMKRGTRSSAFPALIQVCFTS